MTQLEAQQKIWFQRKHWLEAMLVNMNESLAAINLFKNIDEAHAIEMCEAQEKDYQENLLLLRTCHNNKIEANAKVLGDIKIKGMFNQTSYKENAN